LSGLPDHAGISSVSSNRTSTVASVVIGAVVLVVGWWSLQAVPPERIGPVASSGIGGVFLFWIGASCWLSAGLRREWRKLDAIDETLRQLTRVRTLDVRAGSSDGDSQVVPAGDFLFTFRHRQAAAPRGSGLR
jgi:hypothetical protein